MRLESPMDNLRGPCLRVRGEGRGCAPWLLYPSSLTSEEESHHPVGSGDRPPSSLGREARPGPSLIEATEY